MLRHFARGGASHVGWAEANEHPGGALARGAWACVRTRSKIAPRCAGMWLEGTYLGMELAAAAGFSNRRSTAQLWPCMK